jgi:hypothetical protein
MRSLSRILASCRQLGALAACLAALLLTLPSIAGAVTITFDDQGFVHGSVITSANGVSIVADNFTRNFDYAVTFDSEANGTADPDLEADFAGLPRWSGGNLVGEELGLMLILQENESGCGSGVCSSPDDEGRRPAGTLSFLFDTPITSIGFDLIDVDSTTSENGSITFYDTTGASVTRDFATILAGLTIGNNTANRITPLLAESLGLGPIDEVVFTMGGSGAIDNVDFIPIPEPATALFVGLGLAILGATRRSA